ncbi:MAG: GntR family transcriptional regulator [Bacillota bacterium]|nr:GntR family transcriptional regulator [Bacillota bacterium]
MIMTIPAQVKHGSLRLAVYQQLRDWIMQGHYIDGMALTELRVSQELGVSRTPVREAFRQLELDGLVISSPNRSVTVHCFSDQDILDLYEVRSRIEGLAAARAALNMSDMQRQKLEEIFAEEDRVTGQQEDDLSTLQDLDAAFHNQIFTGSGSATLHAILNPINQKTRQARLVSLSMPGRCHGQIKEHRAILDAILRRDSQGAEKQMQRHIARAAGSYRTVVKNRRSR